MRTEASTSGWPVLRVQISTNSFGAADHLETYSANFRAFWILLLVALALGFLLILPIGGADMPVVISMLNAEIRQGEARGAG